ncbi:MAG: adenylate/guanylate cyclase domain-containing protein [Deltaproteobacteria bacterium]
MSIIFLHYLPDDKKIASNVGATILDASNIAGIPHTQACGGRARCSTCRVLILEGIERCLPPNERESAIANRLGFSPEIRLACQTKTEGDIKLRRLVIDEEDIALASRLASESTPSSAGEEKRIAILFADIRGFTSFAEALYPYDVIHVLNRYFYEMGAVVTRNGGYIDNYMGDGLMALFGVDDAPDAAMRSVRAALEMLRAMENFNSYLQTLYDKRFHIGIGVHYGEAVVGTVGAGGAKKMTAIGDAVNLASRIEAATKEAGLALLISEDAYAEVQGKVKARSRCAGVGIRGKSGEYTLYEVEAMQD